MVTTGSALLCTVSSACGHGCTTADSGIDTLYYTAVRSMSSNSPHAALLGETPLEKSQVDSWLTAAAGAGGLAPHANSINEFLATRSFLCAPRLTLGDIAVYLALQDLTVTATQPHLARWLRQCHYSIAALAPDCKIIVSAIKSNSLNPLVLPVPAAPQGIASKQAVATTAAAAAEQPAAKTDVKAAGSSSADAAGPAPKKVNASKKETDTQKQKASSSAAAASSVTAAADEELDPTKLDIRVGVILKAWEHPEAEKLYCEEIDVGEDKPRLIASGLRPFYKLEEMQMQRVLVLANLKARALVGFKSEGMVLCASNADHSVVKFVHPPAGAPAGAKIGFGGKEGEAATPAQVQKKKILEKLSPHLNTDANGTPGFRGAAFTVGEFGNCTSELPDAHVG